MVWYGVLLVVAAVWCVAGRYLGLDAMVVSASFTGGLVSDPGYTGPRYYTTSLCTIVTPGLVVKCVAPAGVGGNYTWSLTVDGGTSSSTNGQVLSYASPMINNVYGPGLHAPTNGGVMVELVGSNFGAVGVARTVRAWASPSALPPGELLFEAGNCTVVQDHVTIVCDTAPGTLRGCRQRTVWCTTRSHTGFAGAAR